MTQVEEEAILLHTSVVDWEWLTCLTLPGTTENHLGKKWWYRDAFCTWKNQAINLFIEKNLQFSTAKCLKTRLKKFSVYKREPKSFMLKISVNTFNKVRSSISSKRITNIF